VTGQVGLRPLNQSAAPFGASLSYRYGLGNAWADANHRYACGVMLSDDGGATFRLRGHITGGVHGHLMEPQVVELAGGCTVMLIRSQKEGWLLRSESSDGGETWSDAVRSEIPNPSAKVNLLKAADGRVFMIHNPVGHQGALMGGRNPLALWVSDDGMKTWRVKADLVKDLRPNVSLNYPSGYLDEESRELVFCWEDIHSLFIMRVPMGIGSAAL
jgi:predicted neuraminidase